MGTIYLGMAVMKIARLKIILLVQVVLLLVQISVILLENSVLKQSRITQLKPITI